MFASIYKITAPNGKSYIGQNLPGVHAKLKAKPGRVSLSLKVYGLKDRLRQHRKNNSTLLKRSIKKYGWENMKVEVLLQCAQEQLNYYEQQMIKAWDTLAPNGLNCTTGGEAGKSLSMETRQNISKALKRYYENHANPQKGLVVVEAQGCVSLRKDSGKFQAIIPKSWNNGKNKCLGLFVTEEEAWAAIAEYKAEHVGS